MTPPKSLRRVHFLKDLLSAGAMAPQGDGSSAAVELRLYHAFPKGKMKTFDPKIETVTIQRVPTATGNAASFEFADDSTIGSRHAVSRRHATLTRTPHSGIMLTDLSSTYGTYLNGTKLDAGIPKPVSDGDTITLSDQPDLQLVVGLGNVISLRTSALLVANNPPDLKDFPANSVSGLVRELEHRGFSDVRRVVASELTLRTLLDEVRETANKNAQNEQDIFVFQYVGHGTEAGDISLGQESLGVARLFDELSRIRAKKLLIILESCHVAQRVKNTCIPEGTLVLIGQNVKGELLGVANATIYQTQGGGMSGWRGIMTNSLLRVLNQRRGAVPLGSIIRSNLEQNRHIQLHGLDLEFIGTPLTLPPWIC